MTEPKFTDEDLKRLKVACLLSVEEYGNQDAKDILALIARLEAEIARREAAEEALLIVVADPMSGEFLRAYEAWLKVSGK